MKWVPEDSLKEFMGYRLGQKVRVKCYPDKIRPARIVGFNSKHQIAHLCNPKEYQEAFNENREPTCIGFPMADVM